MKIAIDHNGIKREIDGPFSICVSGADLARIYRKLRKAHKKGHFYGWIRIKDNGKMDSGTPNTKPTPWNK